MGTWQFWHKGKYREAFFSHITSSVELDSILAVWQAQAKGSSHRTLYKTDSEAAFWDWHSYLDIGRALFCLRDKSSGEILALAAFLLIAQNSNKDPCIAVSLIAKAPWLLLGDRKAKIPSLSGRVSGIAEVVLVYSMWISYEDTRTDGLVTLPEVVDDRMFKESLKHGFHLVGRRSRSDLPSGWVYSLENTENEANIRLRAWNLL